MKDLKNGLFSLDNLQRFADLMDDRFRLPVLNIRVGWDFIIGLVPVAGDVVSTIASCYILVGAVVHGVKKRVIALMLLNLLLDFLVGLIPILGDFLDASFRSNKKNVKLLLNALNAQV